LKRVGQAKREENDEMKRISKGEIKEKEREKMIDRKQ
jgi:hypothetical protein